MNETQPTAYEPAIQPLTTDLPQSNCQSWYMNWSTGDFQTILMCAYNTLNRDEFNRGIQMSNESLTMQHWCSRLTLRHGLSRYTRFACSPGEWKLHKLDSGKLVVDNPIAAQKKIDCSVTHVQGMTACAITSKAAVGIDMENATREFKPILMKKSLFSNKEIKMLRAVNGARRNSLAIKLWTLKEACSKTTGLGAQMDFSKIRFQISSSGHFELQKEELDPHLHDWRVKQHIVQDQYVLSIATALPTNF